MTEEQKIQIVNLRCKGYGYIRIAKALDLSENTVKSFCRRKKLTKKVETSLSITHSVMDGKHFCLYCGKEVAQNPGRKGKKFCSDKCRNVWWNSHLNQVERKANYEFVCAYCKKPFTAYGNAGRKYCCHACYVADRFGGGVDE